MVLRRWDVLKLNLQPKEYSYLISPHIANITFHESINLLNLNLW